MGSIAFRLEAVFLSVSVCDGLDPSIRRQWTKQVVFIVESFNMLAALLRQRGKELKMSTKEST